jgi:hypothetical protein
MGMDDLEIGLEDGFSKHNSCGYQDYAEHLTGLIERVGTPYTILLDAPWGSGKTVFVKQWSGEMRLVGIPVIYFDAFSHDFADDPFIALVGAVLSAIDQEGEGIQKTRKTVLDTAVSVSRALVPAAAKGLAKALASTVLSAEDVNEIVHTVAAEVGGATTDAIGRALEKAFEAAAAKEKSVSDFRDALEKASTELSGYYADKLNGNGSKRRRESAGRMVLVIDDLDRCRPEFAVSLLERLKHIFSSKGVIFILVTHRVQLEGAIKGVYGVDTEADVYLDKFCNVSVTLPFAKLPANPNNRIPDELVISMLSQSLSDKGKFCKSEQGKVTVHLARLIFSPSSKRSLKRGCDYLSMFVGTPWFDEIGYCFLPLALFIKIEKNRLYPFLSDAHAHSMGNGKELYGFLSNRKLYSDVYGSLFSQIWEDWASKFKKSAANRPLMIYCNGEDLSIYPHRELQKSIRLIDSLDPS